MSLGSLALAGEHCKLTIMQKGATGSYELSARITGLSASGFERLVSMEKTFGTHFHNYTGYNPANLQLDFLYDIDTSTNGSPMMSFLGSSSLDANSIRKTILKGHSEPKFYKIKLEMTEYGSNTFGQVTTIDSSIRMIFYNAFGVSIQTGISAESENKGTMAFRVFPFNLLGSSNYIELEKIQSNSNPSQLQSAETAYDTEMGY